MRRRMAVFTACLAHTVSSFEHGQSTAWRQTPAGVCLSKPMGAMSSRSDLERAGKLPDLVRHSLLYRS